MNYRPLGDTGLRVSEIALGSWTTYGGSVEERDSIRVIRRAFELGVNLFDTADVYVRGGAERALGVALKSLPREQLVVATKVMGRVWDGPLLSSTLRVTIRHNAVMNGRFPMGEFVHGVANGLGLGFGALLVRLQLSAGFIL